VRLVLDTNTVLSALLWRGTPYRLLQAIRHQHPSLQLYSSPVLLEELTDVITRPSFTQRLNSIGKTVRQVLADYIEIVELVEPLEVPRIVRDPDDDHVLACALTAKAQIIVSGDKDLLDLTEYQGIPILTTTDALQHINTVKP
jgi:putative PIN family toxin of toxin-antitoxin system